MKFDIVNLFFQRNSEEVVFSSQQEKQGTGSLSEE
jgi:hypothetical protein